jgi:regulator of cell morphogenesis and NO signaling
MMHVSDQTIDEIVRADYRTADVFKKYLVNYCCGGLVSLQSVCTDKKIEMDLILEDLDQATRNICIPNNLPFDEWKLDFLIDYIGNIHHTYIYKVMSSLGSGLRSFADGHSLKYPEITVIAELFDKLSALLLIHTRYEDEVIFPYIKQIDSAYRRKETYGNLFVRTLRKPLSIVEKEHQQILEYLVEMRRLTDNFSFPEKACTNYQVLYQKLEEFNNNLIQHKFLESSFLFPKAIAIEQLLLQR